MEGEEWLPVTEAARAAGVPPGTVRHWVSAGKLPRRLRGSKYVVSVERVRELAGLQNPKMVGLRRAGDPERDDPATVADAAERVRAAFLASTRDPEQPEPVEETGLLSGADEAVLAARRDRFQRRGET